MSKTSQASAPMGGTSVAPYDATDVGKALPACSALEKSQLLARVRRIDGRRASGASFHRPSACAVCTLLCSSEVAGVASKILFFTAKQKTAILRVPLECRRTRYPRVMLVAGVAGRGSWRQRGPRPSPIQTAVVSCIWIGCKPASGEIDTVLPALCQCVYRGACDHHHHHCSGKQKLRNTTDSSLQYAIHVFLLVFGCPNAAGVTVPTRPSPQLLPLHPGDSHSLESADSRRRGDLGASPSPARPVTCRGTASKYLG